MNIYPAITGIDIWADLIQVGIVAASTVLSGVSVWIGVSVWRQLTQRR